MDEPFRNDPINVTGLPRLDDAAFERVDPRYVWGRLAGLGTTVAFVVAGAALIATRSEEVWVLVVAAALVAVLAVAAVVWVIESRRLAYQLREHDLSLRSGVLNHRVETIPFSRVQHLNVARGVVERSLGLATLEVSSAGPDIAIPGLAVADAERIKEVVAVRSGVADKRPLPPPRLAP